MALNNSRAGRGCPSVRPAGRRRPAWRMPDRGHRRTIGRLHGLVAGQRGSDAELLLRPIDISDAIARRRLDQAAQPDARAEMNLGSTAGLVTPVRERNADRMVRLRPSGADSEIVQAADRTSDSAQLAIRRHGRDRLAIWRNVSSLRSSGRFRARPGDAVCGERLPPRSDLKCARHRRHRRRWRE